MFTRKDHHNAAHNAAGSTSTFLLAAVGAALSLSAFAGVAQADNALSSINRIANGAMTADECRVALPALQHSADGEQSGHLQAMKSLETCYTRLGQNAAATFVHWQIDRDLDRADPHDN